MSDILRILRGQEKSIRGSLIRGLTWLASKPYALAMWGRNVAYDRGWFEKHRTIIPIISIGNLTVGGTGKTPAVAMLCRHFREHDFRVAIISRGYQASESGQNDEAMELESLLPDVPHLQNPDRVAAAVVAQDELEMQIIVMDDGFQHRRLERDLDIVLIDATNPFGFGHVLPRGLLRESVLSLARAAAVVITRVDQVTNDQVAQIQQTIAKFAPAAIICHARHAPKYLQNNDGEMQPLDYLKDRNCVLISAIGNPPAFQRTVNQLGCVIVESIVFPDHHRFTLDDIESIHAKVRQIESKHQNLIAICTGKDIAKINLAQIGCVPLYALQIEMELASGDADFWKAVDEVALVDPLSVARRMTPKN